MTTAPNAKMVELVRQRMAAKSGIADPRMVELVKQRMKARTPNVVGMPVTPKSPDYEQVQYENRVYQQGQQEYGNPFDGTPGQLVRRVGEAASTGFKGMVPAAYDSTIGAAARGTTRVINAGAQATGLISKDDANYRRDVLDTWAGNDAAKASQTPGGSLGQFAGPVAVSGAMLLLSKGRAGGAASKAGLGIYGLSSADQGMSEYRATRQQQGKEVNPLEELAVGGGYAAAEILFERIGLNKTGAAIRSVGANMADAVLRRDAKAIAKVAMSTAESVGVNMTEEGATQYAQNIIDSTFDPNQDLEEGVREAVFAGGAQGLFFAGPGGAVSAGYHAGRLARDAGRTVADVGRAVVEEVRPTPNRAPDAPLSGAAAAAAARLRGVTPPVAQPTAQTAQQPAPVSVATESPQSAPLIPPGQQPSEQDLADAREIIMRDPTIATQPSRFRAEYQAARARRAAQGPRRSASTPEMAAIMGVPYIPAELGLTNIRTTRGKANAQQDRGIRGQAGEVAVRGSDVPAAPAPAAGGVDLAPPADQGRGMAGAPDVAAAPSPVGDGVGKVVGQAGAQTGAQPGDVGVEPTTGVQFEAVGYRGEGAGGTDPSKRVGGATFYSPSMSVAKSYAAGGNVTTRTIRFANPLVATNWAAAKSQLKLQRGDSMATLIESARAAGHDGIVFLSHNGQQEYVDLGSAAQPPTNQPGDVGGVAFEDVPNRDRKRRPNEADDEYSWRLAVDNAQRVSTDNNKAYTFRDLVRAGATHQRLAMAYQGSKNPNQVLAESHGREYEWMRAEMSRVTRAAEAAGLNMNDLMDTSVQEIEEASKPKPSAKVARPTPATPAPPKQPWEMTVTQWAVYGQPERFPEEVYRRRYADHKGLVEQALADRKPVPSKVLVAYPDLKPPSTPDAGSKENAAKLLDGPTSIAFKTIAPKVVRDRLKAAGFKFNPDTRAWDGPQTDDARALIQTLDKERAEYLANRGTTKAAPATTTTAKPETVPAAPVVAKTPKNAANATKLRRVADATRAKGEESLGRDRNANTARRARMADSAVRDAQRLVSMADLATKVADDIEANPDSPLANIGSMVQLQELIDVTNGAKREAWKDLPDDQRDKYRDNKGLQDSYLLPVDDRVLNRVGEASMPWINASNFRDFVEAVSKMKGAKQAAAKMARYKNYDGDAVRVDATLAGLIREWGSSLDSYTTRSSTDAAKEYFRRAAITGGDLDTGKLRDAVKRLAELRNHVPQAKENPVAKLERALVGQTVGIDFFPTPPEIARDMVERAGIEDGMRVLEPSAGNGRIADAVKAAGVEPDVVEVSSSLREILEAKGHNLVAQDFNEFEPGPVYDRVLMNPPFSERMDVEHVRRAFGMLKPGGRLVAIMSEGPFFGSDKKAAAFREWLDENGGVSEKLPDGSFAKDRTGMPTTGVAARIVTVDKPKAPAAVAPTPTPTPPPAPAIDAKTPRTKVVAEARKKGVPAETLKKSKDEIVEEIKKQESQPAIPKRVQEYADKFGVSVRVEKHGIYGNEWDYVVEPAKKDWFPSVSARRVGVDVDPIGTIQGVAEAMGYGRANGPNRFEMTDAGKRRLMESTNEPAAEAVEPAPADVAQGSEPSAAEDRYGIREAAAEFVAKSKWPKESLVELTDFAETLATQSPTDVAQAGAIVRKYRVLSAQPLQLEWLPDNAKEIISTAFTTLLDRASVDAGPDVTLYVWRDEFNTTGEDTTKADRIKAAEKLAAQMVKEDKAARAELQRIADRGVMITDSGKIVARPEAKPTVTREPKVTPYKTVADMVKGIAVTAAKETTRYAINGVQVANKGKRLVVTDGRRLWMHDRPAGFGAPDGLKEISKDGSLTPYRQDPDGDEVMFPPYDDIFPRHKPEDNLGDHDPVKLASMVRRAAIVTNEESRGVLVTRNAKGAIGFVAVTPEMGEAHVGPRGTEALFAINPHFMADALEWHAKNGATTVKIENAAPNKPIVITGFSLKDGDKTTSVTMPVSYSNGSSRSRVDITREAADHGVIDAPTAAESKVEAIADAAKERLATRAKKQAKGKTLNAGFNPAQFATAARDTLDLSIVVAAKAMNAKVFGGRSLTAIIEQTAKEAGKTLDDTARRLIRRNARKILKEANGNADAFERITADLFAAPVTKGERKAAARARKEAVAKITQRPPDNAPPVTMDQRDALSGRLKAEEKASDSAGKAAVKAIVGETRRAYKAGQRDARRDAIANIQTLLNTVRREKAGLRTLAAMERRAGAQGVREANDAAKRAQAIRNGIRKQVLQYARTLPVKVRGKVQTAVATADTPVKMVRAVRMLQRELYRHDGREVWRAIARVTGTKATKMKGSTRDLQKALAALRAKARDANLRIRGTDNLTVAMAARNEMLDILRDASIMVETARAEFKAIKGQRKQTAYEIATQAAETIRTRLKAPRGRQVPDSSIQDRKVNKVRRHTDSYRDLRNMLEQLEGKNGAMQRAIWDTLEEGSAMYATIKRDMRASMEQAYARAGFKDLADAIDALSNYSGRGVGKTYTVQVGGKNITLAFGELSSLIANSTDPMTAQLIASEQGQRFKSPEGVGNAGLVPTPDEIDAMRRIVERDYKIGQLVEDFKAILDSNYEAARKVVFDLTGVEPDRIEGRWPRSRETELTPGMEDKPITTADPSMVNVIRAFAENYGIYENRVQTTGLAIKLEDIHSVMEDQIHKQAATIALARGVRDAMLILTNENLASAIIAAKGIDFYRAIKRQVMAAGRTEIVYATPAEKAVAFLKSSAATKLLSTNPSTYLGNAFGIMRVLPDLNPKHYAAGIKAMATMTRADLERKSGYLWERWEQQGLARFGPMATETADSRVRGNHSGWNAMLKEIGRQTRNAMKNAGRLDLGAALTNLRLGAATFMQGLNWVESRIAAFVWGAADAQLRESNPEMSAARRERAVEKIVRREIRETQNGSDPVDAAAIATQNRSSAASLLMFLTSDVFKVRNRIERAFRRSTSYGSKVLAMEVVSSLAKVYAVKYLWDLLAYGVASILGDDDDRERIVAKMKDWTAPLKRAGNELGSIALPIGGPDVQTLIDTLSGKMPYGGGGSIAMMTPLTDAIAAFRRAVASTSQAIQDDDANAEKLMLAWSRFIDEAAAGLGINPLSPWTRRTLKEIETTRESEW